MTAAILTGLRVKKETIGEITAAATVMRELSTKVDVRRRNDHFVDIVGTGGDGSHTFNISTASMFVVAAAGARVAKHGNRSVSSKSGSADVLEALGAQSTCKPEQVASASQKPASASCSRRTTTGDEERGAGAPRDGRAHLFNILGPLTNPAGAPNTLLGVFHPDLVGIQVRVLQRLGAKHVHGGVGPGRHGRTVAGRRDPGRRAEGRRRFANTRSIPRTSA
jgi:anthranilate phosphoribosyltransferase